ncbi:cytochrome P450 [Halobium salinum]|uniref:Cytochrome P450 n=1 Tax=Halobium salinum TaxID=1364940 RepID=A0ABD5PF21_9EURY|nr:cytochrome P450 [Halobium salinum]
MTDADPLADRRSRAPTDREESPAPAAAAIDSERDDPEVAPSPPEHDGLPLLGSTPALLREGLAFGDRLQERGDVVAYDALGERFVAVFDPALVEAVLVSRSDEFRKGEYETEFLSLLAPEGLATVEGERWRRQRRLLQPAFTPARLGTFAETMVDDAATMTDGWADGEVVSLRDDLSSYTLSVLARTLLDVDLDAERGATVREAADSIAGLTTSAWSFAPDWLPTPPERRYRRAMADLDDLVGTLIEERRGAPGDGSEHDDLLTAMLDAAFPDGSTMDESTVRDQLVTFLFAGHETTATALSYACWLLGGHPQVRSRLDEELAGVLDGRDPTLADLPALDYTEAVVREAMRLFPPVYSLYRQPKTDTTLGGYAIPADATLQLATYHVQRDSRWWDAPGEFRPERWLSGDFESGSGGDGGVSDDGDADRPEYAYFPFGGGPRHCIGMRFATMETKLALATIARRVRFERAGAVEPAPRLVLDPGEVRMRVRTR